jgi:DNA sulfur modification protein DndE
MALLTTSAEAREILERFRRSTGVRPNLWARAALGYSLSLEGEPPEGPFASEGTEFQERVLFGDDGAVFAALLRQRAGQSIGTDSFALAVKRHVERGLRHFSDQYERLNRRGDELMLLLLQQCAAKQAEHSRIAPPPVPAMLPGHDFMLSVEIGNVVGSTQTVAHTLNGPGAAPHVAVMGRNSTGKTRTALAFLTQIRNLFQQPFPFLIFDYAKGDIAANPDFVKATVASVVGLPGQTIGLAPLAIDRRDPHSIGLAAHRFRDTICSVVRGLGPKQKGRCLEIIRETYEQLAGATPDLSNVVEVAERRYADNDWPQDSLLACLREFTDFPLFCPAVELDRHEFFDAPHIVDVHRLPEDLRKLAVFLMLDRLYAEIMALPDAPLDSAGNRQMRLIIVIDEAHHYLPCRQPTLEKMVREVRSKGVAIWLLSQSPDDFDQPKYNFAREMGLALVFSCVLERPKMLEAVLGGKVNPKRLSQLPAGVALTRVPGSDAPVEVQAWQP